MIKKFSEFINEDFTDLYKRWKKKDVRKEDSLEIKLKQFISTKHNPQDYYIENGKVCCKGDVRIFNDDLIDGKLPFQFGKVGGNFRCNDCKTLISLEGAPEKVEGDFNCNMCEKITLLKGSPKEVGGNFYCYSCGKEFTESDLPKRTIIKGYFVA